MREVLTISLPKEKKKEIMQRAKKAGMTVSAYIISALELEEQLISEDELLEMAKEAERAYREGRTKVLKSHRDLME